MSGIIIKGTGRYVPEHVVTNEDFTKFLDTSDEWIVSHTGISRRHAAKDEPTWYMGAEAARQAMEAAGVKPEEIGLVIGTTVTPDYLYPSMACMVQGALEIPDAFAFDVSAACAGFTYGLDMARRYLATGDIENVLLVSSEMLTQTLDYEDRSTCILLGDGAGAMVVGRSDNLFASWMKADPTGNKQIYYRNVRHKIPFFDKAPGFEMDPFEPVLLEKMFMNGNEVYRFATRAMPEAVKNACDRAGIAPEELDWIIPHQANVRIIKTASKNLKIPMEKIYVNIQEYGNTSSASIAIGMDECVRDGKLKRGDKVCVVGFGGGLVYGACVFQY